MVSQLLSLPPDLTEEILCFVDARKDLLSLALTCSAIHSVAVVHLQYRTIVASECHATFWAFLKTRPDLARNIRDLTLYDCNQYLISAHGLQIQPDWRLPRSSAAFEWKYTETRRLRRAGLAEKLGDMSDALRSMSGLQMLDVRAQALDAPHDEDADRSFVATVLRSVNGVESLHVDVGHLYSPLLRPNNVYHLLFGFCALRVLDFRHTTLDKALWPRFCEMLSRSPQLQVRARLLCSLHTGGITDRQSLSMPAFMRAQTHDAELPFEEMPLLPCLTHLVTRSCPSGSLIPKAVLAMLARNPPITELHWRCTAGALPPSDPFPALSSLRVLKVGDPEFVAWFLLRNPPGSVRLHDFGVTCVSLPLLADALRALDPLALRRLRLPYDIPEHILQLAARLYTALDELVCPLQYGLDSRPRPGSAARAARNILGAFSLRRGERLNWDLASLDEALKLFPTLRRVDNVDTGDRELNHIAGGSLQSRPQAPPAETAKTVAALRKQYSRLRVVNNWRLQ